MSTPTNHSTKAIDALLEIRASLAPITTISDEVKRTYGPKIYKIAHRLNEDDEGWRAFCDHSDWLNESPRPKFQKSPRKNLLSFVTKFAVGAGSMSSARHAGIFNRLLKQFWDKETPPKLVAIKIQEQQEAKRRAKATKRAERMAGRLAFNFKPSRFTETINKTKRTQNDFVFLALMKVSAGSGGKRNAEILKATDEPGKTLTVPPRKKPGRAETDSNPKKPIPPAGGKGKTPPSGGKGKR
jgi:hypothetical protein